MKDVVVSCLNRQAQVALCEGCLILKHKLDGQPRLHRVNHDATRFFAGGSSPHSIRHHRQRDVCMRPKMNTVFVAVARPPDICYRTA